MQQKLYYKRVNFPEETGVRYCYYTVPMGLGNSLGLLSYLYIVPTGQRSGLEKIIYGLLGTEVSYPQNVEPILS